jgi:hypothetical protein
MKTLQSLLFITEADIPKGKVAVEDLVKYFPSKHSQVIERLWGSDRLTYMGQEFFSGNDHGPVYKGALKAGTKAAKEETINVQIDPSDTSNHKDRQIIHDATADDGAAIPTFEVDIKLGDMQEVYLGFDPKSGNLWIGFDAWTDHNELDDEMNTYMDSIEDHDETVKNAVESSIQLGMKDLGFYGVLVELMSEDGSRFTTGDVVTEPRGFYKGVHNSKAHGSHAFKSLGLIDLRLD